MSWFTPRRGSADLRLLRDGTQIPYLLERPVLSRSLTLALSAANDPKQPRLSRWEIKLPRAGLPLTRLTLTSPTALFQRHLRIFERVSDDRGNTYDRTLASAEWNHTPTDRGALIVPLTSPLSTDTLLVETDNGDNPPIALSAVTSAYPVTRLLFKSDVAPLALYYGNRQVMAPRYDLALVASQLLAAEKRIAILGAEEKCQTRWLDENRARRWPRWNHFLGRPRAGRRRAVGDRGEAAAQAARDVAAGIISREAYWERGRPARNHPLVLPSGERLEVRNLGSACGRDAPLPDGPELTISISRQQRHVSLSERFRSRIELAEQLRVLARLDAVRVNQSTRKRRLLTRRILPLRPCVTHHRRVPRHAVERSAATAQHPFDRRKPRRPHCTRHRAETSSSTQLTSLASTGCEGVRPAPATHSSVASRHRRRIGALRQDRGSRQPLKRQPSTR